MRSRWSPSALLQADTCLRRFGLREEGWTPKPSTLHRPAPHAEFGRIWHASAEVFDIARFMGETTDQATERAVQYALDATWIDGAPWAGVATAQWRCSHGNKITSPVSGRPINCPGTKDWWLDPAYAGPTTACPTCGGGVERREAYLPFHTTKHRGMLLRAVVDYCDEALDGVAAYKGAPALELDLEFRAGGVDMHCILDRYTELGRGAFVAHERKSSSRYPHWDGYLQTFQVRFYPEALRQNGLKCSGVLLEHYQIMQGGTQRSAVTLDPGPDHFAEAAWRAEDITAEYASWGGSSSTSVLLGLSDGPARFSSCAHAAGGMPCEFIKVCTKSLGRRAEVLAAEFERKPREQS